MKIRKIFAIALTSMLTISAFSMTASATTATVAPTEAAVAPENTDPYSGVGAYMAFMQIQTTTWVYRNNFDDAKAGFGSDIFKTVYNNETKAATSTVISDALLDGDGEYTISLSDISLEGSTDFNMVAISTNIPLDAGIEITAATLKYGSKTITSAGVQKDDNKKFVNIMMINQYDKAMKDAVNPMVPADGSVMSITFTVTGFGFESPSLAEAAAAAVVATVTPAPVAASTSDTTTATEKSSTDMKETKSSSIPTGLIIGIIAGVVVLAAVIIVVLSRKKKKS